MDGGNNRLMCGDGERERERDARIDDVKEIINELKEK